MAGKMRRCQPDRGQWGSLKPAIQDAVGTVLWWTWQRERGQERKDDARVGGRWRRGIDRVLALSASINATALMSRALIPALGAWRLARMASSTVASTVSVGICSWTNELSTARLARNATTW